MKDNAEIETVLRGLVATMRAEAGDDWYWFDRELKALEPKIAAERAKIARAQATIQRATERLAMLEAKQGRALEAKAKRYTT